MKSVAIPGLVVDPVPKFEAPVDEEVPVPKPVFPLPEPELTVKSVAIPDPAPKFKPLVPDVEPLVPKPVLPVPEAKPIPLPIPEEELLPLPAAEDPPLLKVVVVDVAGPPLEPELPDPEEPAVPKDPKPAISLKLPPRPMVEINAFGSSTEKVEGGFTTVAG